MIEDQQDLFTGRSIEEARIEAAKLILLEQGYRVVDPIVVNGEIDNQKKLCNYFYMRMCSNHPNRRYERSPNNLLDMQMISKLVHARMDTGLEEMGAIQECVSIIDTIFNYEEEFTFKYPVVDTTILGQGKSGWVTAKALKIMDDKIRDAEHEYLIKKAEEVEDSVAGNQEEVENKLNALLRIMEDRNG